MHPDQKGTFGMYLEGIWYRLRIREGIHVKGSCGGLDASILQNHLLGPILGIEGSEDG